MSKEVNNTRITLTISTKLEDTLEDYKKLIGIEQKGSLILYIFHKQIAIYSKDPEAYIKKHANRRSHPVKKIKEDENDKNNKEYTINGKELDLSMSIPLRKEIDNYIDSYRTHLSKTENNKINNNELLIFLIRNELDDFNDFMDNIQNFNSNFEVNKNNVSANNSFDLCSQREAKLKISELNYSCLTNIANTIGISPNKLIQMIIWDYIMDFDLNS